VDALDPDIGSLVNPRSIASRIILIAITLRIPTAKRQRRHSESTTENPKITYESESTDRCTSNLETVHRNQVRKRIDGKEPNEQFHILFASNTLMSRYVASSVGRNPSRVMKTKSRTATTHMPAWKGTDRDLHRFDKDPHGRLGAISSAGDSHEINVSIPLRFPVNVFLYHRIVSG
jgi:hypothetical protein